LGNKCQKTLGGDFFDSHCIGLLVAIEDEA